MDDVGSMDTESGQFPGCFAKVGLDAYKETVTHARGV